MRIVVLNGSPKGDVSVTLQQEEDEGRDGQTVEKGAGEVRKAGS